MIDEFEWQLSLYRERHDLTPICQGDSSCSTQQEQKSAITTGTKKEKSVIKKNGSLEDDVKILTDIYGPLCPTKHIDIDLDTACTLLHRNRHRVDAFSRLIKYLYQEYQTTLKITSRKTH